MIAREKFQGDIYSVDEQFDQEKFYIDSKQAFQLMDRVMPGDKAVRMGHNTELEEQFEAVERQIQPDGDVHKAFIEMTKLLRMFYGYLVGKNESKVE